MNDGLMSHVHHMSPKLLQLEVIRTQRGVF